MRSGPVCRGEDFSRVTARRRTDRRMGDGLVPAHAAGRAGDMGWDDRVRACLGGL